MKTLNRIFCYLVYVLPAVLFFSYYPVISLGSGESMNFEFSLPLLWLVLFDIVALLILIKNKKLCGIFRWWILLLFPIFVTISLIWSQNLVRGVLTTGILWLIYFATYAVVTLRKVFYDERGFCYVFLRVFFVSSLVICAWCLIQSILDAVGVARETTLMCPGCVSYMFGFPHPNGFAIEPQFMGNLLLAPTIVSGWLLVKQHTKNLKLFRSRGVVFATAKSDSAPYCSTGSSSVAVAKTTTGSLFLGFKFLACCFLAFSATLFLTFSRGAIYAFIVAIMFMSGFLLVREKKKVLKKIGMVWGLVILSFLFTLNMQGIFAQVGPTNDTYGTGVAKVLNHLSLGIIDIRGEVEDTGSGEIPDENESAFDGYVEESTNIRLGLTKNAIKVWLYDFKNMLFGVGIGGAGQAMYDAGLTDSPKEIVQNEYVSLLLEVGLVGVILAGMVLFAVVKILIKNPVNIIILTLMVGYGVSLLFFSGFPNALQIYLLPPVFYIVFRKKLVS